jgi:hypothetical protein
VRAWPLPSRPYRASSEAAVGARRATPFGCAHRGSPSVPSPRGAGEATGDGARSRGRQRRVEQGPPAAHRAGAGGRRSRGSPRRRGGAEEAGKARGSGLRSRGRYAARRAGAGGGTQSRGRRRRRAGAGGNVLNRGARRCGAWEERRNKNKIRKKRYMKVLFAKSVWNM